MGAFSDRFDNDDGASSRRPECYGDPDYYDITDERCRQCPVKGTCRIKVQSLEREHRRASVPSVATQHTQVANPANGYRARRPEPTYTPPDEDSTFLGALAYNVSLDAATASFETIAAAFAKIPREGYPSIKRKRR